MTRELWLVVVLGMCCGLLGGCESPAAPVVDQTRSAEVEVQGASTEAVEAVASGAVEGVRAELVRELGALREEVVGLREDLAALREDLETREPIPTQNTEVTPEVEGLSLEGIREIDAYTYEIPGVLIDRLTANPKLLIEAREVFGVPPHIQPVYKNREISGFRILRVMKGSIYHTLGLRNGDLIKKITGEAMTNPQRALRFLDALRETGSRESTVTIDRRGQDLTLRYRRQAPVKQAP